MALFPASPANGATANVNGYQFTFNSTDGAWNRTQSFTGNLAVTTISASGNANVGNLGVSGLITATGNITGANLIGVFANGNSNISIPAANGNVNISAVGNTNILVVTGTGANITGTLNVSGITTFSGVGQQILGDFSNTTLASRTVFQSKTANTATDIPILPNGTNANGSSLNTFNLSNIANSAYVVMGANSTVSRLYSATTGTATLLPLVFGVGSTEAARFATDGTFFAGATSFYSGGMSAKSLFSSSTKALTAVTTDTTGGGYTAIIAARQNTDGSVIECWRGSTIVGQIQVSASGTSYGTISDYRLKNNPQPLSGSGEFIDALKPKTWTWTISGQIGTGFIAHEVAEVSPSSVFGEKDAINEDGTPRNQSMEYGSSEFIAHIIAELQDLRRRFAQLETEVNNLKNS
jgi:hypothetical protein